MPDNSELENHHIFVINVDGSYLKQLTFFENDEAFEPSWCPDGSKIAFSWCIDCELFGRNVEIFVYDFNSDSLFQVTNHLAADDFPIWSLYGDCLVFASSRNYHTADTLRFRTDLYSINIDGTDLQQITNTGYATNPIWMGAKTIIYRDFRDTETFVKLNIETLSGVLFKLCLMFYSGLGFRFMSNGNRSPNLIASC